MPNNDKSGGQPKPSAWTLEGRLAKNEANMQEAKNLSDQAGLGAGGRGTVGILSIFGAIAAIIPTIIYFGILAVPLFLLYSCLSAF